MANSTTPASPFDDTDSEASEDRIDAEGPVTDEDQETDEESVETVEGDTLVAEADDGDVLDDDAVTADEIEDAEVLGEDDADADDPELIGAAGVPPGVGSTAETVTAPPPAPVPVAPPPSSGPGFVPLLLGGVLAGAIGYGVAWYQLQQGVAQVDPVGFDSSALDEQLAGQGDRLAILEDALNEVRNAEPGESFDATPLVTTQAELQGTLTALSERVVLLEATAAELVDQIQSLEQRPALVSPDGSQAMAEQLAQFQNQIDSLTAAAASEIEAAQARASEIEKAALDREAAAARETGMAKIEAALENGSAYEESLSAFDSVPDGLSGPAGTGVPTLAELQDSFPAAARRALAETQTVPEDSGITDRVSAFFRRQTNARSLEPRDGNDTDAVLSRAEAALSEGDLNSAINEVDSLTGAAADQMADWRAAAVQRRDALAGAETLASGMDAN